MTRQALTGRVHEQLHKLPGRPEHSGTSRPNHRGGLSNRPVWNRPLKSPRINHGHKEPAVLVGWRNGIARFFSRQDR